MTHAADLYRYTQEHTPPPLPGPCTSCLYFRFNRLVWWCCHPNHNRRITGMGCKGEDHVDRYIKPLPGHAPSWPPPVPPEERSNPQ